MAHFAPPFHIPVSVLDGPVIKTDTVRRKPQLLPLMGIHQDGLLMSIPDPLRPAYLNTP